MLELRNVTKTYRRGERIVTALDNASLTVENGTFLAIVGQSGSGKSTLMHILGCLDLPDTGTVSLNGIDYAGSNAKERAKLRNRDIGFIFQSFNLLSGATALENVELPLAFRGIPRRKRRELAAEALEAVGLTARAGHFPGELSGGQQQRVAVARAIAARPGLILADEPTGNLDPEAAERVLGLLEGLNREGTTVVLITHDMGAAARAERRVCLEAGKVNVAT